MKPPPESRPAEAKRRKGQFVKGQSGNPGGQRKEAKEMREAFLQHVPRAMEKVMELVESGDLGAIRTVFEYGLGKPAQSLTIGGDTEKPLRVIFDFGKD